MSKDELPLELMELLDLSMDGAALELVLAIMGQAIKLAEIIVVLLLLGGFWGLIWHRDSSAWQSVR